ncbi:MAG: threonine synthase [Candidatus Altiarchaeota archaeon]|nr:threonine synthase [Candidatus Altiarchaeota archaeon]
MDLVLKCIDCGEECPSKSSRYRCECGGLLEVVHDLEKLKEVVSKELFDKRLGSLKHPYNSGVWRYKELILPVDDKYIISKPEGNTNLYCSKKVSDYTGARNLAMKHEGENPTGSFKDRGMTAGITQGNVLGARIVACASTGNTSASMAAYGAARGMKSVVFIPQGEIAYGKLAQALAYGARTIQIRGNFDDAMRLVQEASTELGMYLLNSINPFRIEGQKAIGFETLQQRGWRVPDWFVLPGGNLGNGTALGKGLSELYELGIIDKVPRIGIIQAAGANPLYKMWNSKKKFEPVKNPETVATAIRIGNPVSWKKLEKFLRWSRGVVEEVTDQEIVDAKAVVDSSGIGAEPASCASIAGLRKLVGRGIIKEDEDVVAILTGHVLKDPNLVVDYHKGTLKDLKSTYQNKPVQADASLDSIKKLLL